MGRIGGEFLAYRVSSTRRSGGPGHLASAPSVLRCGGEWKRQPDGDR